MKGNVSIDGTVINSVGVQLKGNSSFGYPGQKKPIKLSFNEYVVGQKLEGLTSLNLNNNVLDPTQMREKLMLDFMNRKGLPAPRCTYAKVSYNGQYVGLYKMIEPVDKAFINARFANWGGNLFKGDPAGTLQWINNIPSSYYNSYELHSNTTLNNWSDLVNLIDNINNTPAVDFYDTLETNLNTTPLIQQWAARNLFVDLDGYFHAPHNYYLYHNLSTNKFEWVTWDVSVSFGFYPFWSEDSTEHTSLLMANSILTSQLLANPTYKATYLNTICDYLTYLDTAVMSSIIDSIANRIYPAFAAEPDSNQMFPEQALYWTCDTFTVNTPVGDIPGLKRFISNRRNNVLTELASLSWTCTVGRNNLFSRKEKLIVYPNPTSGRIDIESENREIIRVFVSDLLGNTVFEGASVSELNLSYLANGVYFLQAVLENNASYKEKIIISK